MDRIKALYGSFSKSEVKVFRSYLEAFHHKGENKPLRLVEIITKKPEMEESEIAKKLYGNPRSKAFIMMKSRLYEKMTEFLMMSVNPTLSNEEELPENFLVLMEQRKSMIIATALRARKLNILAEEYLEKALRLSQENNFPELEVDALIRYRTIKSGNLDDFNAITREISRAMAQQEVDVNIIGIRKRFFQLHKLKTTDDGAKPKFLQEHIPELETTLNLTYSPRADYFLQTLKIHYFSISKEYVECKNVILYLIDLVSQHKGLQSPTRKATPWLELGILELKFANYDEALQAFQRSRAFLSPNSGSYFTASLLMVYALIYQQDLEEAWSTLKEVEPLIESPFVRIASNYQGMFSYLIACVHYLEGRVEESWDILQNITELNFDKGGWITGIRIFELMIIIDLKNYDLAIQKVENLRKHLSRYHADERSHVIYRLLHALERNSFSFTGIKRESELLEKLTKDAPWVIIGHEVVRVDDWWRRNSEGN